MRVSVLIAAVLTVALVGCKKSSPARTSAEDPWAAGGTGSSVPRPKIDKPFLFAVTHPDHAGVTTYLFGTMHIGIDGERQLPTWVWSKLDAGKAFAMEADVSEPSVMQALARSDGSTLEAELGAAHWKKLKEVIGDRLADGMNHMKPFAVMTVLATKDLPLTPPMDQVMARRAADAKKEVVYLETALRQLEIIDPFMTGADIKAYLDNLDYARTQTLSMIKAYAEGDGAALAAMFEDQTLWKAAGRDPATFTAYVDAILGNRNASWIAAIEQIHAKGGGFVAVGAGHLVGPRSVGSLLEAKGYTVTRVTGP